MTVARQISPRRPRWVSNDDVADALERVAVLLGAQAANPFRVRAYQAAADRIRTLDRPLWDILEAEGVEGLERLRDIGPRLANSIRTLLQRGRLPILDRLEGEVCPEALFTTIPGIGSEFARRIHEMLGIETLEDLEIAAHDGRLRSVPGFGPRRTRAVRETLGSRLGRASKLRSLAAPTRSGPEPRHRTPRRDRGWSEPLSVEELLAIDREYRELAGRDVLVRIAPRRFNPDGERWLPLMHDSVGAWDVTAMFSNTALAHRLGRTRDWVVIYADLDGIGERYTVVTESRGVAAGLRVVRGREPECADYYARIGGAPMPEEGPRDELFLPGLDGAELG